MAVHKIESVQQSLSSPFQPNILDALFVHTKNSLSGFLQNVIASRTDTDQNGFAQLIQLQNKPILLVVASTCANVISAASTWCLAHRSLLYHTLRVHIHPQFKELNPFYVINELMQRLYVFDKYKTEPVKSFRDVIVMHPTPHMYAPHYVVINTMQTMVRQWIDEPANIATPMYLAEQFRDNLTPLGVRVALLGPSDIRKYGMSLIMAAGQGSSAPPFVVVAEYNGGGSGPVVAIVGKGVTYDTGGINLKPSGAMRGMKSDMAGAALAMGTLGAVAQLRLPLNVVVVVGMVENMIGENATRPGDVVISMSGKSIEITDTDAEGRLVLADLLWFTGTVLQPTFMLDVATLTGAIGVALGPHYGGMFSDNMLLTKALMHASLATQERLWHMPLLPSLQKLKSSVADYQNHSDRERAGALFAATFLRAFVPPEVKGWAHLDLASMLFDHQENISKPYGVKLLLFFLMEFLPS